MMSRPTGRLTAVVAGCLGLAAMPAGLRGQEPAVLLTQSELFVNVTVVDGRGGAPRPESAILVWGGEIRAIGSPDQMAVPEGTTVVDLEGAWVVPGLIDVSAEPRSGEDLTRALLAGVTGVRSLRAGTAADTVSRAGSDLDSDGPLPWTFQGGPPIERGEPGPGGIVASAEAAAEEVARQAGSGARIVTVGASVPAEWIPALTRAGRRADVRVWSDRTGSGWLTALRAGVDVAAPLVSLDPELLPEGARADYEAAIRDDASSAPVAWLERLDPSGAEVDRAIGALLSRDASVTPLLARTEAALACPDGAGPCDASRERGPAGFGEAWPSVAGLIAVLREQGVRLLAGSATPAGARGEGFHRELELMVDAGVPPLEVLSIASRNGAITLGMLHERGTLETGKKADFVVLGSSPVADIRNARDVRYVFIEGRAWRTRPETGEAERVRFR